MGRKPSPNGPTRLIGVRVPQEVFDWYHNLGDYGPIAVKAAIDELRISKDGKALDRKLADLKDHLTDLEEEALEVKKEIREIEGIRAKVQNAQMDYLRVRQNLLEKYLRNPDPEKFEAWVGGPAQEHYITEGKFNNPREVAQFCKAEYDKRRVRT